MPLFPIACLNVHQNQRFLASAASIAHFTPAQSRFLPPCSSHASWRTIRGNEEAGTIYPKHPFYIPRHSPALKAPLVGPIFTDLGSRESQIHQQGIFQHNTHQEGKENKQSDIERRKKMWSYFIPPTQSNQEASRYVFNGPEVKCEQQYLLNSQ